MRLKELREARHLTQSGLGMACHMSQSLISAYELGRRVPSRDDLTLLADYFGVSVDYLLGRTKVKDYITDLKNDEIDLLSAYRVLNTNQKDKLISFLQGLLS